MTPTVQIKGIREGLLVVLGEGNWDELHTVLLEQIDQQGAFLKGGRVALEVGNLVLKAVDLGSLRDELSERGVSLWAVLSNSPTTEKTAQALGMATRLSKVRPERPAPQPEASALLSEQAILVRRTLRSGVSLQFAGHIVVIGDVNPGAEVIATGDVVVWGRLRGMVHAGAEGNEEAVACALDLTPTQLRIAGQIAVTPQRRGKPQPEMARIKNGQVVAQAWNPNKKLDGRE
jgi:septum site-determining protein MinC